MDNVVWLLTRPGTPDEKIVGQANVAIKPGPNGYAMICVGPQRWDLLGAAFHRRKDEYITIIPSYPNHEEDVVARCKDIASVIKRLVQERNNGNQETKNNE